MSFRVLAATVVRRRDHLIPAGFMRCAAPRCGYFARFPTEKEGIGYCHLHDERVQRLFNRAKRKGRGKAPATPYAHIVAPELKRWIPAQTLDISNVKRMRSLCGIEVTEHVALQSRWLSFHEGRYWLNAIVGARPLGAKGPRTTESLRLGKWAPLACLSCVNAYSALLREEHLGLPGRVFVLRITAVENERVVLTHPEGPGIGHYVSRDQKHSLDLTAACIFATLEDAIEAAGLFESTYADSKVTVAVRRLVEDPDEECSTLDPLQERLAWYGGAFRRSDGKQWHTKLRNIFGIRFEMPHEDTPE